MGTYHQTSFAGGMDMLSKDTDIAPNAYRWLYNGRARYGWVEAINKSIDITFNLPPGQLQGVYAVGAIVLAFKGGKAYYYQIGSNIQQWFQIPNFQLDQFVPYIYAQAVPGSTNNFFRQGVVDPNTGVVNNTLGIIQNNAFVVDGTPAGVVVQDGINIPWLISYDNVNQVATARELGQFNDWTPTMPEYVPIGGIMMYLSPVLYIVSPDGFTIYRSVSGSPLNFMINVDPNGNKLSSEALGGARSTSFAQDFDTVTSLLPSTSEANTFIIGTARNIYGMQLNYTTTIFNEPTFTKAFQLAAGVVNNFSVADINNNTAFIDFGGIRNFNAVQSLKFEGRNDPLSKMISQVFANQSNTQPIIQKLCCCFTFNNYTYFSVKTIFGYVFAVLDTLTLLWQSFDITNVSVNGVIMMAEAVIPDQHFLIAATTQDRIFIVEGDDGRETAAMNLRSFITGEYTYGTFFPHTLEEEHKLNFIKVQMQQGELDGTLLILDEVDNIRDQYDEYDIPGVMEGVDYPVFPPVIADNTRNITNKVAPFNKGLSGYKIVPILRWNNDIHIERVDVDTTGITTRVSGEQQVSQYGK